MIARADRATTLRPRLETMTFVCANRELKKPRSVRISVRPEKSSKQDASEKRQGKREGTEDCGMLKTQSSIPQSEVSPPPESPARSTSPQSRSRSPTPTQSPTPPLRQPPEGAASNYSSGHSLASAIHSLS